MHTEVEEDEEDQEESSKQDDVAPNTSIKNGEFRDYIPNNHSDKEELYILLDELEENGTFNHEYCQKTFNAIEDIHNKLSN